MKTNRPILLPALCSLSVALSGCASFNDALVVDIGDQFDLWKLALANVMSRERFIAAPWSRDGAHVT